MIVFVATVCTTNITIIFFSIPKVDERNYECPPLVFSTTGRGSVNAESSKVACAYLINSSSARARVFD